MEKQLIDMLRETAHDLQKGESTQFYLRRATQQLKDGGCTNVLPEKLSRIIKGLAEDGRDEDRGLGSLRSKRLDEETLLITLQREWSALDKTAQLRRAAAEKLLNHILTRLPQGSRGTDLLAETTLGKLLAAIEEDLVLKAETKAPVKLLDRALMWLHEMEIIRLNKGLAVFRPAMTIHLGQERRNFMKSDFLPLQIHYQEQVLQIHIMAEYVQRGLQAMAHALQLAMDYFHLEQESFLNKWLPGRKDELTLQTTPESWRSIVENLRSPIQQRIVADDREQTNVLVLAGPGSGKTRVLVHRIAYLIRVKRENPRSIIALAYNRHAAVEIRERLHGLIHDDANGITVMTCHALAMRLVGASFAKQFADNQDFKQILKNAVALLKGSGLPPEEADEQRSRLLAGFRWMLVDEYQDIDLEQYELISALAGRTLEEEDGKLTLFAVGDDDQNIYGFDGASVEFIRRFASDYQAKPTYLVENYRSTKHIIDASNLIISPASQRMKTEHPITINHVRSNARPGGDWEARDPVARGRVQILPAGNSVMTQAVATMAELMRLASLSADWRWDRCAVIAREWSFLEPVRAWCEMRNIPVQMADEDTSQFWRLRETQALVSWVRERGKKLTASADISLWLDAQATGPWWSLLWEALDAYVLETSGMELPTEHFLEWLAEWGREFRRKQQGLLLLTAHRAKGLEFDHVAVLDGAWEKASKDEDRDASRRLYYVAMTRARETLLLARFDKDNALLKDIPECPSVIYRPASLLASPSKELTRKYQRLSLREIDIGYAGRYRASDVLHQKITELQVADSLQLLKKPSHWELANSKGETVGKLSKSYSPPLSKRLVSGKVTAIVTRLREDSEPEYQDRIRCDRWEVVVPELVFE